MRKSNKSDFKIFINRVFGTIRNSGEHVEKVRMDLENGIDYIFETELDDLTGVLDSTFLGRLYIDELLESVYKGFNIHRDEIIDEIIDMYKNKE